MYRADAKPFASTPQSDEQWRESIRNMRAKSLDSQLVAPAKVTLAVVAGVALMTLSAKIRIPFWPVPMTLHTLAVMGLAVACGPRIASSIVLAYLAAGAAGLPVFSNSPERGIGIGYLLGPTGGYLMGYLVASWVVGTLAFQRQMLGRIGAMLVGLLPIYGIGLAWLTLYVPVDDLVVLGVAPFLLGDILKIGVVAVLGLLLPGTCARPEDYPE